jgi:Leucine-rich repeat (LRR) protein
MASSIYVFFFIRLLFLLSLLHLILTHSPPFMKPLCHDDESSALLQFKESFIISSNYPPCQKVASWALEGDKSDCCSWDGVECDKDTGHVIGLDLSNSCLFGSINSTSSLFHLVHLKRLNLAYNYFNYSPIPPQVRNLSKLTYLNLTASMFSGQIPSEISQLSHLTSLHLCYNYDSYSGKHLLELRKPVLTSLIRNLTHLQELGLDGVSIFSVIPTILANFSSLTSLYLHDCGLHGEFPVGIFKLPNLQVLDVGYNKGLIGYLSDFTWSSPLEALTLAATGFSGELPPLIGNLIYLNALDVSGCNFTGSIPSSLGNLTNLTFLSLSYNTFNGEVPSSFGKLNRHYFLRLCQNQLTGRIPNSIFNLTNLQFLDLGMNYFSGTVEFDEFVKLKHLTMLYLSYNQFSLLFKEPNANATFPKFQSLWLSSCNLSKFPDFLRNQDELEHLVLSDNNLADLIPEWMLNIGKASLELLCLSNNSLTGFAQHPILLPWTRLAILDLRSNLLQGLLPTSLHFAILCFK